jgi:hypothetical protein
LIEGQGRLSMIYDHADEMVKKAMFYLNDEFNDRN